MSLPFDPREKLIIVPTRVFGPKGEQILRFALDTGASRSMLSWDNALNLGYFPDASAERIEVTTASSVELASLIMVDGLVAIGQQRQNIPMICHALPPGIDVGGVLGLDFFRGRRLTIDFRIGLVTLE